jgi:O-antigen ligase
LLFLFLPFSQALTLSVGFPLKISEIMLFILIFFLIVSRKKIFSLRTLDKPLFVLLIWSFFSVLVNLVWHYPYGLNFDYPSRAGTEIDSILKWFYFLLAVLIFTISSNVFRNNREKYITYFLYGAVAASVYGWYLFGMSLLGLGVVLLPGMDENPQTIGLAFGEVIRCGTFKEGNFMALFLFVSTVIALYGKRKWMALFFTLSIITTVSTIGMLTLGLFWLLYILNNSQTKKGLIRAILIVYFSLASFAVLLQNDDFNTMFVSKLNFTDSEIVDQGAYSKEDRKNTIINALYMGFDNPIFGIGLSNYALHYKHYNEIYGNGFKNYDFKVIANNVYAEIFSEAGLVGLLLFGLFLHSLSLKSKQDESRILTFGLWGCFFYFMAFPTFTVLFIWIFFGLINSLSKDKYVIGH